MIIFQLDSETAWWEIVPYESMYGAASGHENGAASGAASGYV